MGVRVLPERLHAAGVHVAERRRQHGVRVAGEPDGRVDAGRLDRRGRVLAARARRPARPGPRPPRPALRRARPALPRPRRHVGQPLHPPHRWLLRICALCLFSCLRLHLCLRPPFHPFSPHYAISVLM